MILVLIQPELIYNILGHRQVFDLEQMYDPQGPNLNLDREAKSDVLMFAYYIKNNISVGFQTFATGLLAGLGTVFYLIFNGIHFGAVSAHMINIGYQDTFFTFIIAHCAFELTAITIAGAGGLILAHAIINPGQYSRKTAIKLAADKALTLLYGLILMLIIAAFFEAFWSSNFAIPIAIKYLVGLLFWALVIGYFFYAVPRPQASLDPLKPLKPQRNHSQGDNGH